MEFLHLLPVSITYCYGYLQLCGRIFHDLVDVLIYGIDLFADGIHSSTKYSFFTLGLAD